jgi:signal transduction histidine kinase
LNRTIDDVIKQYNEGSVAPVNIDFKPYPQALSMETQETYLAVLVDEILDNAVRYSNVGQKIIIRTERTDDEHARFILEDTGVVSTRICCNLCQTYLEKGAPMPDYIGLGLQLIRGIGNAMEAKLELKSEAGTGTTFTITFKLVS